MGKRRYKVGGGGISNNFAKNDANMMMRMSNICFLMEITVVVFVFPVQ